MQLAAFLKVLIHVRRALVEAMVVVRVKWWMEVSGVWLFLYPFYCGFKRRRKMNVVDL